MKQFFKFTFASMLGFIIAGVLLIFIGTATFVGALSGLAEDADGKRLFTLEDKMYLMKESVTLISDIAGKMFSDVDTVEDAEKN